VAGRILPHRESRFDGDLLISIPVWHRRWNNKAGRHVEESSSPSYGRQWMKLLARPSKTKSGGLLFMLTLAALLFLADEAGARSKQSEAKANMKAVFTPQKALSSGTKGTSANPHPKGKAGCDASAGDPVCTHGGSKILPTTIRKHFLSRSFLSLI
jgi:hypothetical protein